MLDQTHVAPLPRHPSPIGQPLAQALRALSAPVRFRRNEEIYAQGDRAGSFYQVVGGSIRTYQLLSDGRRQIGAFYMPGDVFGLEDGEERSFSAEAVVESSVRIVPRSAVMTAAAQDSAVAADLWAATARSLRGAQEHMILLGRKTAEERIASFLLKMDHDHDDDVVELPMSRQDIADYLGLTIETVSRTFTHLENSAAIELISARRVALRNRANLQRLNS